MQNHGLFPQPLMLWVVHKAWVPGVASSYGWLAAMSNTNASEGAALPGLLLILFSELTRAWTRVIDGSSSSSASVCTVHYKATVYSAS